MVQALIAPVLLATAVGVWLAWLKRREWAEDRALTVRAEIQSAVNRALEGESLLAVQVEPASSFHPGRVVLSTPMGYEWLVRATPRDAVPHGLFLITAGDQKPTGGHVLTIHSAT